MLSGRSGERRVPGLAQLTGGLEDVSAAAKSATLRARSSCGRQSQRRWPLKLPARQGRTCAWAIAAAPRACAAGFLAGRMWLHGCARRADAQAPQRIVGQTTDVDGAPSCSRSGPRAAHPPREGGQQHLLQSGAARSRRRAIWARWALTAFARWPASAMTRRIILPRRLPSSPAPAREGPVLPRVRHGCPGRRGEDAVALEERDIRRPADGRFFTACCSDGKGRTQSGFDGAVAVIRR